jgi:hypothetical protein
LCDNQRLQVTKSLYSALRRLRNLGYFTIWADAICINQADDIEKGQQVQMMGHIYKHAQEVICDLGEADWQVPAALELLHIIISSLSKVERVEVINHQDFEQYSLPDLDDEKWLTLGILLSRPWFRRVWVKQEVCLATRPLMLWGETLFEWDLLDMAMNFLGQFSLQAALWHAGKISLEALSGISQVTNMSMVRKGIRGCRPWKLTDLLWAAQESEATDPRDRIYSMLGLTIHASDPGLYVSYSESTSMVYKRVSKSMVEKYGTDQQVGILLLYRATGPGNGMPSWILDWERDNAITPMTFGGNGWYHAADGTLPNIRTAEDDLVVVAGSTFDYIERVSSVNTKNDKSYLFERKDICKWVAVTQTLIRDLRGYPTGETSGQAFKTTLIADSGGRGKLDADIVADSYQAYITLIDDIGLDVAEQRRRANPFRIRVAAASNRRFCVTRNEYFGLLPPAAQVGDLICLLLGGDAPVVLRRDESDGLYSYIGDCYVHGIMYGEALKRADFHIEDFVLK